MDYCPSSHVTFILTHISYLVQVGLRDVVVNVWCMKEFTCMSIPSKSDSLGHLSSNLSSTSYASNAALRHHHSKASLFIPCFILPMAGPIFVQVF